MHHQGPVMKPAAERQSSMLLHRSLLVSPLALSLLAFLATGCATSTPATPTGPVTGQSTQVALLISSTANGQFVEFAMTIESISLTNKTGKTTTIYSTPTDVDFIHSNANASPLATVSVPQDVYTSAAIAVSQPRFSYTFRDSQGGITNSTDAYNSTQTPPVVVLAQPIAVSGSTMGLTVNLQAAASGSLTGLAFPQNAYTINPTFNLTSFAIPAQSTISQAGKCIGLTARVTSINTAANSMTLALASDGTPISSVQSFEPLMVSLNSATQFQGISSATGIAVGTFVDMDVALQSDASYLATRVEVQDSATANVASGQLLEINSSSNYILHLTTQQQGDQLSVQPNGFGAPYTYAGTTKFQTSARFPNLNTLPFTAIFNSATLTPGQKVSIGSPLISYTAPNYTVPDSITLVPQTIDATVLAMSGSGNYTVYTVQLATYDPIVQMNSPAGNAATTLLPHANVVEVYVSSSTSLFNTTTLAEGQTFRFNGLLFNDAGTLRMVCDQVNDGVPQ
jgi:hypothetical protein